jgi:hypothetical protein
MTRPLVLPFGTPNSDPDTDSVDGYDETELDRWTSKTPRLPTVKLKQNQAIRTPNRTIVTGRSVDPVEVHTSRRESFNTLKEVYPKRSSFRAGVSLFFSGIC